MLYKNVANGDYFISNFYTTESWIDNDAGDGVSTLVTYDGNKCFKMDSGSAGSGNYARRNINTGVAFSSNTVVSVEWYHESLGVFSGDGDDARLLVYVIEDLILHCGWGTDGLYIFDGASWNEVGTDLVKTGEWQYWSFDIKASLGDLGNAVCDVYLNGEKVVVDADCSYNAGSNPTAWLYFYQYGNTSDNNISYFNYIICGSDHIVTARANNTYLNDDCSDILDWVDVSTGDASFTQTSYDGEDCYKADSGPTAGSGHRAIIYQNLGSFGNTVYVSVFMYSDALGLSNDTDYHQFIVYKETCRLLVQWSSDGLFIHDGVDWNEVETDIVLQDSWHEWTFEIDFTTPASATVNVFLDGIVQKRDVDCSNTGSGWTNGQVMLVQRGDTTASRITYISWLRIGDDFSSTIFVFSAQVPQDDDFTYILNTPLQIITTVGGLYDDYICNVSFYNTTVSSTLISTTSGVNSGECAVSDVVYTPDAFTSYKWYVVATTSGDESTSPEYSFNRNYRYYFSGAVKEEGIPVERVVRAYNRETGEFSNYTVSSGGSYYLTVDSPTYSGTYDIVCLDNSIGESYNDLILGNMTPIFIEE